VKYAIVVIRGGDMHSVRVYPAPYWQLAWEAIKKSVGVKVSDSIYFHDAIPSPLVLDADLGIARVNEDEYYVAEIGGV